MPCRRLPPSHTLLAVRLSLADFNYSNQPPGAGVVGATPVVDVDHAYLSVVFAVHRGPLETYIDILVEMLDEQQQLRTFIIPSSAF